MKPQAIGSKRLTFYTFHDVESGGFGTPFGRPPSGDTSEEARSQEWFREIQLAVTRLRRFPDKNGATDEGHPWAAAMRWAIALAEIEWSTLSEGGWRNLQYEFEAFVKFNMQDHPYGELRNVEGPTYGRETIAKVQGWLTRNLANLVGGAVFEYEAPKEQHYMHLADAAARMALGLGDGKIWLHQIVTSFGECPGCFFHLLGKHVDALCRCEAPDCRGIFLRDRRNQVYCSKTCLWRMTTRRARQTPAERFNKPGRPTNKPAGRASGANPAPSLKSQPKDRLSIRSNKQKAIHKGGKRHGTKR